MLWNDLPIDIRSIDDVNKFKSKLKTFLFKRVYELSYVFLFCTFVTMYIYTYICNDFRIFIFFIQNFLKHCKALSTEKYKLYINILLLLLLLLFRVQTKKRRA